MNKVKYGLSNVHYAKATINPDGTATYETPVPIPGAVNMSLDAQGANEPFYADNTKYYVTISNTGYEGDLEVALFPDSFKKDVLGFIEDKNGVLVEDAAAVAVPFALTFQFEGDKNGTRHVLFNCTATRPSIASATKEETTNVQTETTTISAATVYNSSLKTNISKASCPNDDVHAAIYAAWNGAVYQPEAKEN